MTKSEFIFVVVRLSGAVLVAHATWATLGLLSGLYFASTVPPSVTVPLIWDSTIRALIELTVGFYLILDGRLLYFILDRER